MDDGIIADPIQQGVHPAFHPVAEQFAALHTQGEELGSAFCVYWKGERIVHLWDGHADCAGTRPWQSDTRVSTFSACKPMVALCLLHLIDRGCAGLDDPVIRHWPEFARGGGQAKSQVTLRHVLSHRAGLPVVRAHRPGDVFDWNRMIQSLEDAPLLWPGGEALAYHAVTFGHLVGALVFRISGRMPSAYFQRYFAGPLALDYSLRFDPNASERTAETEVSLRYPALQSWIMGRLLPPLGGWKLQYFRPCDARYQPNSDPWRRAEIPAVSGFGSAEGLARIYAMLAGEGTLQGQRVLSRQCAQQITHTRPTPCRERATGRDARVGLGVFFNLGPLADFGPNPNSLGHCGMGGCVGFADPDRDLGFGYVCNRDQAKKPRDAPMIGDRARRLIDVLYQCLDCADPLPIGA